MSKSRFQSTHPHGVRLKTNRNSDCNSDCFNPRTHTGCDGIDTAARQEAFRFNPRTHTGCDFAKKVSKTFLFCFNPRTHTGCDENIEAIRQGINVSIHAPTRGATEMQLEAQKLEAQFQSTHPHGVRLVVSTLKMVAMLFQSTHPHGVRHARLLRSKAGYQVSIHAPTRGATQKQQCSTFAYGCFNPRTHTGCDFITLLAHINSSWFQSTHPHGVRRVQMMKYIMSVRFQSTHPHGVRHNGLSFMCNEEMFQSTHPHGVRRDVVGIVARNDRFNPRTHTGCDTDEHLHGAIFDAFQSTHPHGVRRKTRLINKCGMPFQSTHPHGVRLYRIKRERLITRVSIHAPTRGATDLVAQIGTQKAVSIHAPTRGAT